MLKRAFLFAILAFTNVEICSAEQYSIEEANNLVASLQDNLREAKNTSFQGLQRFNSAKSELLEIRSMIVSQKCFEKTARYNSFVARLKEVGEFVLSGIEQLLGRIIAAKNMLANCSEAKKSVSEFQKAIVELESCKKIWNTELSKIATLYL